MRIKKIAIGAASFLAVAAIIAGAFCYPSWGKTVVQLWSRMDEYKISETEVMKKEAGKDFKILQLADIQLFSSGKENDAALALVKKLANEQKPDLIVLTGDNVSGFFTRNATGRIIDCMEEIGIPWAPVYGNHDGEGQTSLKWQGEQYAKAEHCLYNAGPSNVSGEGNYIVNITENDNLLYSLFMMDSHNRDTYEDGSSTDAFIKEDQIAWYEWAVEGASKARYGTFDAVADKVVPSMAFFHIPLPEMITALQPSLGKEAIGKVTAELGSGEIRERICAAPYNSGFFDAMKNLGSTTDVFVGHDHANDASVTYEGIRMTYGVKTGPSPHQWNDAVAYGGTLITIKDQSNNVEITQLYDSYVNQEAK